MRMVRLDWNLARLFDYVMVVSELQSLHRTLLGIPMECWAFSWTKKKRPHECDHAFLGSLFVGLFYCDSSYLSSYSLLNWSLSYRSFLWEVLVSSAGSSSCICDCDCSCDSRLLVRELDQDWELFYLLCITVWELPAEFVWGIPSWELRGCQLFVGIFWELGCWSWSGPVSSPSPMLVSLHGLRLTCQLCVGPHVLVRMKPIESCSSVYL